jgi:hypothetical protein
MLTGMRILQPTIPGRGAHYTRLRHVGEAFFKVAYRGDWPARAWSKVPSSRRVRRIHHTLRLHPKERLEKPLRVAFASDLHLGPTTPRETLDAAFRVISESKPDVLILGGDYVFLEATQSIADELEARVAAVPARTKVAVLGNHDLWTHHERLERALRNAGAAVLINDAITLPDPYGAVAILGVDEPWTGSPDGARAKTAANGARFRIGVGHSPDALPHFQAAGVGLVLVGHTHGGQIALPGPTPVVLPGILSKQFPYGLHQTIDTTLFVSRGVGGTELPIRMFAPPDIAIFDLI